MWPLARVLLFGLLCLHFDDGLSTSTSSGPSPPSCLPNAIAPIAIPIRNVTMQGSGVRRGAALSMGTPPQNLAFSAVNQMNDTHIYDLLSNPCSMHSKSIFVDANATQAQCFSSYGGLFDESKSSSWSTASSASAIGISDDFLMNVSILYSNNYGNVTHGVDVFLPSTDIVMAGQPFVVLHGSSSKLEDVPSEPYLMNSLGLGTNSTLLNALVSAGNISSRIWSYWDGWTGAASQNQSDGSLVLGGYDAALTTGNNITVKFTTDPVDLYKNDCNLIVTISDIQLKFPNGTMSSLLGPSRAKTVRYCIIPSYLGITLTNDTWVTFGDMTGTQYLDSGVQRSYSHLSYWNNIVQADTAYDGDLVISVDPGLEITIPNHELVQPLVDIDPAGQEYIVNGSEVRLMAFNALDLIQLDQLPTLGRPFFSSAYMMVDNDQQQATLWAAKPAQHQDLKAVGPPGCPSPSITSNIAASTATQPSAPGSLPSSSLSRGIIAGISVVVAFIIAVCFGVGYFLVKRISRRQHTEKEDPSKHTSLESETPMNFKPELPSDQQPPQEMPLGKAGMLSPSEMDGDQGFRNAKSEMQGDEGFASEKDAHVKGAHEMYGDYGHAVAAIEMPNTPGSRGSMKHLPVTPETDKSTPQTTPGLPMTPRLSMKVVSGLKRKPLPKAGGVEIDELNDGRRWI